MLESSKVVLTFESIDEILQGDHSNEIKPLLQYFHEVLFAFHYFTKRNLEILLNFNFGHFCSQRLRVSAIIQWKASTVHSCCWLAVGFFQIFFFVSFQLPLRKGREFKIRIHKKNYMLKLSDKVMF